MTSHSPEQKPLSPERTSPAEIDPEAEKYKIADTQGREQLQKIATSIAVTKRDLTKWKNELKIAMEELHSWSSPEYKEIWQEKSKEVLKMNDRIVTQEAQLIVQQEQMIAVKGRVSYVFEKQPKGRKLINDRDLAETIWHLQDDGQEYSSPKIEEGVIARVMGKKGYEYSIVQKDGTRSKIESESSFKNKEIEADIAEKSNSVTDQKEPENEQIYAGKFSDVVNADEKNWSKKISEFVKNPQNFSDLLEFCLTQFDFRREFSVKEKQFQATAIVQLQEALPDPRVAEVYAHYMRGDFYNRNVDLKLIEELFCKSVQASIEANLPVSDELRTIAHHITLTDKVKNRKWEMAEIQEIPDMSDEFMAMNDAKIGEFQRLQNEIVSMSEFDASTINRLHKMYNALQRDVESEPSDSSQSRNHRKKKISAEEKKALRIRFQKELGRYSPENQKLIMAFFASASGLNISAVQWVRYERKNNTSPLFSPAKVPEAVNSTPSMPVESGGTAEVTSSKKETVPVKNSVSNPTVVDGKVSSEKSENDPNASPNILGFMKDVFFKKASNGDGGVMSGTVNNYRIYVPVDGLGVSYIENEQGEKRELLEPTVHGVNVMMLENDQVTLREEMGLGKLEDPYADHRDEILESVFLLDVRHKVFNESQIQNVVHALHCMYRNAGESLPKDVNPFRALGLLDAENHLIPGRAKEFAELFALHSEEIDLWTFQDIQALTQLWQHEGKFVFASLIQLKMEGYYAEPKIA